MFSHARISACHHSYKILSYLVIVRPQHFLPKFSSAHGGHTQSNRAMCCNDQMQSASFVPFFLQEKSIEKKKVLEQLLINYIIRVGGWVCRHIISICQLYCEIHCNRADHRKSAPFSTAAGTLPWHCGAVEMWPGMGNACGHTKDTGNPNTIARCSALERFYDCGCHGIRVRDYCACSHNWWGICKDSIYHI